MIDCIMEDGSKPPSNLTFKISGYLAELSKSSPAVKRQFFPSAEEVEDGGLGEDPLEEDSHVLVKGLVQKYPRRVLLVLTISCCAYCRFCTRRRMVDDDSRGTLTNKEVDEIVKYLKGHKEINEVIISGGDPLSVSERFGYVIDKLKELENLKILRIHTRVPVSNPKLINEKLVKVLKGIRKQIVYLSIHFEHPDELTKETMTAVEKIRKTGAILLSQSVFLRGVNDSVEVLKELFTRLVELGVRPYYIFRCDPVKGAGHFMVPFEKEREIMTRLRSELSGIACPTYVIDAPGGSGKVPVPLGYWGKVGRKFRDYLGEEIGVVGP